MRECLETRPWTGQGKERKFLLMHTLQVCTGIVHTFASYRSGPWKHNTFSPSENLYLGGIVNCVLWLVLPGFQTEGVTSLP